MLLWCSLTLSMRCGLHRQPLPPGRRQHYREQVERPANRAEPTTINSTILGNCINFLATSRTRGALLDSPKCINIWYTTIRISGLAKFCARALKTLEGGLRVSQSSRVRIIDPSASGGRRHPIPRVAASHRTGGGRRLRAGDRLRVKEIDRR
jgi:hypothetical protein